MLPYMRQWRYGEKFFFEQYLKTIHNKQSEFNEYVYYDFERQGENDVSIANILLSWVGLIGERNSRYRFDSYIFTYNQYQKKIRKKV